MVSEALTKLSNYNQMHLVILPISDNWVRLAHFAFSPPQCTKTPNRAQSTISQSRNAERVPVTPISRPPAAATAEPRAWRPAMRQSLWPAPPPAASQIGRAHV